MRTGLSILLAVTLCLWGWMRAGPRRAGLGGAALEPWRTPVALVLSGDGKDLFVANRDAGTVSKIRVAEGRVVGEVAVGNGPIDLALSGSGRELFVPCHHDATVAVIDPVGFKVVRRMPVDPFPRGVAVLAAPKAPGGGPERLYTSHSWVDILVERDIATGGERAHLAVGRCAGAIVPSADGSMLAVSALQSTRSDRRRPPEPEVDIVDTATFTLLARVFLPGANVLRTGAWTGDGSTFLVPLQRPKNLLPNVKPGEGWLMDHGLAVLTRSADGFGARQLLLADAQDTHTEPHQIVIDGASGRVFVAAHAAGRVAVLDLSGLLTLAATWPADRVEELAGRMDLLDRFESARIATGAGPRALALGPDGQLFVACSLDDTIAVVDTRRLAVTRTIALHPPRPEDPVRRGQRLFSDNRFWYHGVVSCSSCHPDSHQDGLAWDLGVDGLGKNRVDVRSLYGAAGTEPFKWLGSNPGFHAECGPRAARLILRSRGFDDLELDDCVAYLRSLVMPPNPFAAREADRETIERGRAIFFRTVDTTGRPIPPRGQCAFCHPAPRYTNRRSFDVETKGGQDTVAEFDTPQLENLFMTGPYLHDGSSPTLEEIFTVRDPKDKHGVVNDLGKDELNDLIVYMRSLGPGGPTTGTAAASPAKAPYRDPQGDY